MEFNIGPGVKYLYAMFHIEDVWDHSGVKSPTIAMPMLIDSYVDLTARPICAQVGKEKINLLLAIDLFSFRLHLKRCLSSSAS